MKERFFKPWECAVTMGLMLGLLTGAGETMVLSRWQPSQSAAAEYRITLFPFGVSREAVTAIKGEVQTVSDGEPMEYHLKWQTVEWLKTLFG